MKKYDIIIIGKDAIIIKLFCVSDIHSHYTLLKKALDEAGFDPNNKSHMLISIGDELDRGDESKEVIDYLISLPRKVIIKGNHTDLLLDCLKRKIPYYVDYHNGTVKTICDLTPEIDNEPKNFKNKCDIAYKKIKPLTDMMINYYETENYVFTHSSLPVNYKGQYDPNWRRASKERWNKSRWGNPFIAAKRGNLPKNKTLVFGHFHTSYMWSKTEKRSEWGKDAKFDPYFGEGFIGIDGCTAHSNKVNVVVLEDDLL